MGKKENVETPLQSRDVLDAYRAPGEETAPSRDEVETSDEESPFYVSTPVGVVLFHWMTLGIYSYYWMFQQWRYYRRYSGERVSPFWRMVFPVFFAHALFARMSQVTAEKRPNYPPPSLGDSATVWVVLTIVGGVLNRITPESDDAIVPLIGLGVVMTSAIPLALAQRVANLAAGDPESRRRPLFQPYNLVGLCLLAMFWGMAAYGTFAP